MTTNIIMLFATLFCCCTYSFGQNEIKPLNLTTIDTTYYDSGVIRTIELSKQSLLPSALNKNRGYTYKSIFCYDDCSALRMVAHFDYSKDYTQEPIFIQSCWSPRHNYCRTTTFDNSDCDKVWIKPLIYDRYY